MGCGPARTLNPGSPALFWFLIGLMIPDHVHGDDNHRADRLDKGADLSSMPISRSGYATLIYFDDAALACVYSGRSAAPVAILVCKLCNIF
jgi:hypothetical protein